jgi:myb proto-oncogene protein
VGKWTKEEDVKLIEAVEEFGKVWVRVAARVPGRSESQCARRWHKSLDPPAIDQTKSACNEGKWAVEEDAKLTDAVKKHGVNNWIAVAVFVPGRTYRQCHDRWAKHVDPIIKNDKWAVEEDAMMMRAVKEHGGSNWVAVAAMIPGRTNEQCHQRWFRSLNPGIKRGKWTEEEDGILTVAVLELGDNWDVVSTLVPGRTNDQCRARWVKHVDPTIDPTTLHSM